ncbi:MAG TPA: hypothetical protein VKM93_11990 [Terriglobia bacterium]|nr:hypothetical protein [Terriglobia bacterium]
MQVRTAITWEEFLAAGEEDQRWEWVDGEVEFMSPAILRHEQFIILLSGGWPGFAARTANGLLLAPTRFSP